MKSLKYWSTGQAQGYDEAALSERIRRELFHWFNNDEFDAKGEEHRGKRMVYEDLKLEILLVEVPNARRT